MRMLLVILKLSRALVCLAWLWMLFWVGMTWVRCWYPTAVSWALVWVWQGVVSSLRLTTLNATCWWHEVKETLLLSGTALVRQTWRG